MDDLKSWYVIKQVGGECAIVSQVNAAQTEIARWGPYASQQEAIARRVGLIRAGKCKPS